MFVGFHSVRTRVAYGVTMAVTLHPSSKRTSSFRLKSVYFHYSTKHLFKDVEIKSQQRLRLEKNVTKKNMIRETHIFVHKHMFVPITFTRECHIHKIVSNIEDRNHGD